jgi:molybdopterin-containing oxidoreductase family iron-sulfur binding subunit
MPELDRREFLKAAGVAAGAAAAAACREPVEKAIPYLIQPEEIVPGLPTYYASTCRECPVACGIQVKTREGRPIKVDGNPEDPVVRGALCVRGQASLGRTYDAARFRGPMRRQGDALRPITWEEGIGLLVEKLRAVSKSGRVAFVTGQETGALDALVGELLRVLGSTKRLRFEPYAQEALRAANAALFGTDAVPHFDLEKADFVVAFGTDFLETWLDPVRSQIGFASARRGGRGFAVYVGPRLSLSGANADLWIAPRPGTEMQVALALAAEVARVRGEELPGAVRLSLEPYSVQSVARTAGVDASTLEVVARRLAQASAPLALPPGSELLGTNGADFATAVQLLNVASGALGQTVRFGPDHNLAGLSRFEDLKALAGRMRGGEVEVLLVHGANPVYAVPAAFGFADAVRQVPFKVSFQSASDETTALADLVLPDHTPYESWGDAEPIRGVRRLQQPTIRPIFDTRALGDVLLEVGRALGGDGAFAAPSFRAYLAERWRDVGLEAALARGGDFRLAADSSVSLRADLAPFRFAEPEIAGEGELTLLAYPSLHFYDGRSARLAMLQELPDPVTKTAWGSYAELHPETAARLGVSTGDLVRVSTEVASIELPVFAHETIREDVLAIAVGQGHQPVEPEAPEADRHSRRESVGVSVLSVLPGRLDSRSGGLAWLSTRVRVAATGETRRPSRAQHTFDQEGRGFAQATTLAALLGREEEHPEAPHLEARSYSPADDAAPESAYRWGMSIDLDACVGCNACIAACNQENNVPAVGPRLLTMGREMQWIRVERYVESHGPELEVRHLPMLCQHCGAAPCESVCPVLATYHDSEGLNVMTYNRCIGTRYCSNNCPYKVRRFNWFPFDFDWRHPESLGLNPDVTVRSKGVMEKCTFCVQRIHGARDRAKAEGREIRDGEITPACAQACPSRAIVFGNLRDLQSAVSQRRNDSRAYTVLPHLNTRPAISYLKSVRRGSVHRG